MRLVNKDKLLAPGKCLVCERIPQARVVDTLFKNFNNVASDPMRGRKYVCDRCGEKIAKALAYPSPQQYAEALDVIESFKIRVIALEEKAHLNESVQDLIRHLEEQKADVVLED